MDELVKGVRKPKHKIALFLCGSSGTGKTSSVNRVIEDAGLRTTFVYLNADKLRDTVRSYEALQELAFRIMKEGYSIVWDKTCRNVGETQKEIMEFKKHGYKTILSMLYANVDTVVKRVSSRTEQPIPEDVVRRIFRELRSKAERYLETDVDELFLYNNDRTLTLIFHKNKKHVTCLSPKTKFYFDISEYC